MLNKGFFGVGVENISKSYNLGNLVRSAHAFGASFFFTVHARYSLKELRRSDTTKAVQNIPFYDFEDYQSLMLPKGCQLVGVELTDDAIDLPSFHHPKCAAYILGPERGSISLQTQSLCDYIIKIPTQFCLNVGIAGALVMYDRTQYLGKFAPRPVRPGGPQQSLALDPFGPPLWVRKHKRKA